MYISPEFRETDGAAIRETIRAARLANLVTVTASGLIATPLPLFYDEAEGALGALYGHIAKANTQWQAPVMGEALVIFMGPDAYITPSWYPTKQETGKVVPTWNYVAVHAYGTIEFFTEEERLLDVVTRLTTLHESSRPEPWAVTDAPPDYIKSQLRSVVGLRMPISRLDAKRKMSQNRSKQDRDGVAKGLAESQDIRDNAVSRLIV
ncbi:FMN-binding negative transcriptional regulator [Methylocystis bryophila]|uniref:Transcriptional regulator n=1 Tax=Methylocystis bryophila TaxID=655015 RepID=A0A1W6MQX3_9HYPH|nr:FMN-binding negative transcriptional regulator [Methylocystis bryophila]ARN79988.1 transcriptional regulator [Methylocystis bryophila]BDV39895.1 transcriptional regulator [Methylocystis bryophila]